MPGLGQVANRRRPFASGKPVLCGGGIDNRIPRGGHRKNRAGELGGGRFSLTNLKSAR